MRSRQRFFNLLTYVHEFSPYCLYSGLIQLIITGIIANTDENKISLMQFASKQSVPSFCRAANKESKATTNALTNVPTGEAIILDILITFKSFSQFFIAVKD